MSTFKDSGIVLRETPHGEYDKNLTVLLSERGKSYLYLRGARRQGSKLRGCEPFSYCEFVVFEGKGFLSVTQLEVYESYYNIRNDYDVYCRAANMLELAERLMQPQMNAANTLSLMRAAFEAMCRNPVNSRLVHIAYIMKLLELEGFRPELNVCADCGRESVNYMFGENGLCCRYCAASHNQLIPVSKKTIGAMSYIYNTETSVVFTKNAEAELLEDVWRAISLFESLNLELKLKSKKLLE